MFCMGGVTHCSALTHETGDLNVQPQGIYQKIVFTQGIYLQQQGHF